MRSLAAILLLVLPAAAQEKKAPPKPPNPKIAFAVPLGVVPGTTTKLTVRGLNLDQATEVRFAEAVEGAEVRVKSKGKAEVPKDAEAAVYGDTKLDLEVLLPAGAAPARLALVVVNPAGTTEPHELAVTPKERWVLEKESNGGFRDAQPLEAGKVLQGAVGQAMDVDVFKLAGKAGEWWEFDVRASRHGSPLDALLTLYDAAGTIVAVSDDGEGTPDPTLRVKMPADGAYSLVLVDAHNQGGASHVYLLHARRSE